MHAIADYHIAELDHAAAVADAQTVAENSLGPRKPIGALLDAQHLGHIVLAHRPKVEFRDRSRFADHRRHGCARSYTRPAGAAAARRRASSWRTNFRSVQALRFSL